MWLQSQHTKHSEMPCCAPDDVCKYTASFALHCAEEERGTYTEYARVIMSNLLFTARQYFAAVP